MAQDAASPTLRIPLHPATCSTVIRSANRNAATQACTVRLTSTVSVAFVARLRIDSPLSSRRHPRQGP